MEVLSEIRSLLPESNADFFSKILFKGRLAQNYKFLEKQGVDKRRYSGFVSPMDFVFETIYRIYNNRMRNATGTLWEPMHGPNGSKEIFQNTFDVSKIFKEYGTSFNLKLKRKKQNHSDIKHIAADLGLEADINEKFNLNRAISF